MAALELHQPSIQVFAQRDFSLPIGFDGIAYIFIWPHYSLGDQQYDLLKRFQSCAYRKGKGLPGWLRRRDPHFVFFAAHFVKALPCKINNNYPPHFQRYSARSTSTAAKSTRPTAPLSVKKATLTRERSSGRTIQCSYTSSAAVTAHAP